MLGAKQNWFHETLSMRIGKSDYVFRTLSLHDVWILWPYLLPIKKVLEIHIEGIQEAARRGKPLDFADRKEALKQAMAPLMNEFALPILRIIQPVLSKRISDPKDEASKEFKPTHWDYLINFYERQDWERIKTLVEYTTAVEAEARQQDPEESEMIFVYICNAAARTCNMPMPEFIQQRFEFCADQIVTMRKASELVEKASAVRSWDELAQRFTAAFGVSQGEKSKLVQFLDDVN